MRLLRETEVLAFDRGSARSFDEDGRLHVSDAPISKANVCPYRGREIPRWRELGLDPDRTYQLLRDPEELRRAAPTFNGLPILDRHVYTAADDHPHALTIGATGSEARFDDDGYLRQRLVVWPKRSIDRIARDEQKELSSSYHYDADMTPGTFGGVAYDGVMRNIRGNHVAVVPRGRAGPDVVVCDAAPSSRPRIYGTLDSKFVRGAWK